MFDTVGHNAYPETSAESPGARHGKHSHSIDEGDLDRLLAALRKGFPGTAQPLPGSGGVTVWYLEDGFQTIPDGAGYSGTETDKHPVSEDQQAAQLCGRHPARVLPARRRRLLQLRAARRRVARRVAVGTRPPGLEPEARLHRVRASAAGRGRRRRALRYLNSPTAGDFRVKQHREASIE